MSVADYVNERKLYGTRPLINNSTQHMDTVFVSFDFENDKRYKYLLEAWHANPKFRFVFDDGTPTEIDSTNVGRVKAALTTKIKDATHTLILVGAYANQPHRNRSLIGYKNWINFEARQSADNGKRIAVVMLEPRNELPEELSGVHYSVAPRFGEAEIMKALQEAPFYPIQRYG